jgi:transcriptional regulator with XRE-family HTH domain
MQSMTISLEDAFGRVVHRLRKERHLSQERLADLSNLDRTSISLLERGKQSPTLRTLVDLASAMELTPSELLRQVEQEMVRSEQERAGDELDAE